MPKVLIERYGNFDIEFDTSSESFQCVISDDTSKQSKSLSAVRKFIDDYEKANNSFSPFYVESNPDGYMYNEHERLKIVGVRKDGRFISEGLDGKVSQVSDYDLSRYIIYYNENDTYNAALSELMRLSRENEESYRKNRKAIISQMKIVTLKDYKRFNTQQSTKID